MVATEEYSGVMRWEELQPHAFGMTIIALALRDCPAPASMELFRVTNKKLQRNLSNA